MHNTVTHFYYEMSAFVVFPFEWEGPKKRIFRKKMKLSVCQLLFNCFLRNLSKWKNYNKDSNSDFWMCFFYALCISELPRNCKKFSLKHHIPVTPVIIFWKNTFFFFHLRLVFHNQLFFLYSLSSKITLAHVRAYVRFLTCIPCNTLSV